MRDVLVVLGRGPIVAQQPHLAEYLGLKISPCILPVVGHRVPCPRGIPVIDEVPEEVLRLETLREECLNHLAELVLQIVTLGVLETPPDYRLMESHPPDPFRVRLGQIQSDETPVGMANDVYRPVLSQQKRFGRAVVHPGVYLAIPLPTIRSGIAEVVGAEDPPPLQVGDNPLPLLGIQSRAAEKQNRGPFAVQLHVLE